VDSSGKVEKIEFFEFVVNGSDHIRGEVVVEELLFGGGNHIVKQNKPFVFIALQLGEMVIEVGNLKNLNGGQLG
jgi:hypothetical protein